MNPKHYTIPIFIPEMACPFQCVFCNQQKITGTQLIPVDDEIIKKIETHLASFKEQNRRVEIGFFGGSFTGVPFEQQKHYLEIVQPFLRSGEVAAIRVSTRPDYIGEKQLALLKEYGVQSIELGAQSFDEEVLRLSFRGHTAQQTETAAKAILKEKFKLGLQMMIGLPGDSLQEALKTAKRIIELGAHNTRIYPAVVIKDTVMHQWYEQGKYKPLSLSEAVEWAKQIVPLFEKAGLKILRVGLHPSEGLLSGDELVAGPFHPSFKELVLTEIWGDLLKPLLKTKKPGGVLIRVPAGQLNAAIGHQAKNKKMLLELFRAVKFVEDEKLDGREFRVVVG
ncbi:MAG: radical SAM protein [Bacteroidales bacterium]|nr:radical SAM protein [Bacteroidales bacterium]